RRLRQGRYREVRALARIDLAWHRHYVGGLFRMTYANSLTLLGMACLMSGDYAEGEEVLQQALVLQGRAGKEKHRKHEATLVALASLYSKMGNYPAAETLFRK